MKVLLEGLSELLTEEQKAQLFPIAKEWVDGDVSRDDVPEYVDFGEKVQIKSQEWPKLKEEMMDNFETKEEHLKRFQQNDEGHFMNDD